MPNSVQSYNHSFEHTNYSSPFCKKIEDLYGKSACTINLHLHLLLKEYLLDYGPVHGMWCFGRGVWIQWNGMVVKQNLKIIVNLCQLGV